MSSESRHQIEHLSTVFKMIRKQKGISQEDFSIVSSRTFVSSIERGLKNPTIQKLDELCGVLGMSLPALLLLVYAMDGSGDVDVEKIGSMSEEARHYAERLTL